MRTYNKWYKELWWWIIENKEWLAYIFVGAVIGLFLGWSYVRFLRGI